MYKQVDNLELMTVNSCIKDKTNEDVEYSFINLFVLDEIQKLQDAFSFAMGVASIITDIDGTPLTKPSNSCSLCFNVIRKTEKGLKNCMLCESIIGKTKKDGPQIKKCFAGGLTDGGASIIVNDKHVANWFIGQVLTSEYSVDHMLAYADEIGADRDLFIKELNKAKCMPKEEFAHICESLFLITQLLSTLAVKNVAQNEEISKRKIAEGKIKVLNSELEDKIFQRTAELQEMNRILEEKVHKEVQMQERLQKYQLLAENTNDAMFFLDKKGNILETNVAATRIYGYSHEEFSLMNMSDLRYPDSSLNTIKQMNLIYINGKIYETVHFLKDRTAIDVEVSLQGTLWKNQKVFLGIVRNITERKRTDEKILYLSYHDQLTGLYNRRFYDEELKKIDKNRNLPITVAVGDVNGLKLINDTFGHAAGDELLKKVAEVIKKSCRKTDIVARLGGDEFVILLPKTDSSETEKIIKRIKNQALNEKADLFDISISFGYETKNSESENIHEIIKKAERYMYRKKLFESQNMKGNTINTIIDTLHKNNKLEELHCSRVADVCEKMGMALDLSEDQIMELKTVGLLHDIGKIAIDESVLHKPQKLTDYEWKEIKRHSEIGYRILSTADGMSDIAECVLYHHERWDGRGYPIGLKGEKIPLMSRIVSIIDAYDAMTSDRSYRYALPENVALEELEKNAGTQFDSKLVSVFIEKVLKKLA